MIELGISDHDLVYCTRKIPSLKLNKYNDISIRSIKLHKRKIFRATKKNWVPRLHDFYCLNKAYQDFIFKLSEVIDLLSPPEN